MITIFDNVRKGQIFLWKWFGEDSKRWDVPKGRMYGKLPDCVKTDLEREYRELTGADLDICSCVTNYAEEGYSVIVRVRKDCRKEKFLRLKGFIDFC